MLQRLIKNLVLLFVFWYCHKRGRETRLEREKTVDSSGRVIELRDDPMIEAVSPLLYTLVFLQMPK